MKADDIELVLATGLFHFRRCVLVPNVSWGMLPWEADLLVLTSAGYLYEIEIKVSIADLKRDSKKGKWRMKDAGHGNILRGMYYAMPLAVWQHADADASVGPEAGVIVIEPKKFYIGGKETGEKLVCRVIRPCRTYREAQKLSDRDRFQLARLGTMRYWSRKVVA